MPDLTNLNLQAITDREKMEQNIGRFSTKKILIFAVFIILSCSAYFLGRLSKASPYLFELTEPVQELTGTVVQKDQLNSFVIKAKTRNIKVVTTDQTIFGDAIPGPGLWPYLLKPRPLLRQEQKSIANISPGSRITVKFKEDLRTIKKLEVTASRVLLFPYPNSFKGTIKKIQGNQLIVEGSIDFLPGPDIKLGEQKVQTFTVNVTPDTEISRIDPSSADPRDPSSKPKVLTYTLEDLKKSPDLYVGVFTNENVLENTSVTALRIEPLSL